MTQESKDKAKSHLVIVAILVGWFLTIGNFVWAAASKDTQYIYRLDTIEEELEDLDSRLDTAEAFRLDIRADLAEIKTDLLWIRKELEQGR
mgnify:FL=1|tara:strand:+ start:1549 stop:1821 length:273 start_codon:yes stop_codon:yes gene_type:complete